MLEGEAGIGGVEEAGRWLWRQERQFLRPLLTVMSIGALFLGALQVWIAGRFATKDELRDEMRVMHESLSRAHADHMADYIKIENSVEAINRLLIDRLPRPGERP